MAGGGMGRSLGGFSERWQNFEVCVAHHRSPSLSVALAASSSITPRFIKTYAHHWDGSNKDSVEETPGMEIIVLSHVYRPSIK